MSSVTKLHVAVKRANLASIKALLDENRGLANSRSETDGEMPTHFVAHTVWSRLPSFVREALASHSDPRHEREMVPGGKRYGDYANVAEFNSLFGD